MKSVIWTCFLTLIVFISITILFSLLPNNWTCLQGRLHSTTDKVNRQCKQLAKKERQSRINWNYMYYYEDRQRKVDQIHKNLIWCKVPKAGSTTLTKIFLRLAGARNIQNETKIHRLLRAFYPRLTKGGMMRRMKTSFKFVVVRDPFERILSAYRDKLENLQRDLIDRDGYYYKNYGRHMTTNPVNNHTMPIWQEFVNYLINTPVVKFDEHWMPIHRLCSPCNVRYDAIVKMENFNQEILLPLRKGGIYSAVGWSHKTGTYNNEILRSYFQNISFTDINKLYKVYKRDFTLFDYSPSKYFGFAHNNTFIV